MFLEFLNEKNQTTLVAIKEIVFIEEYKPHEKNKMLAKAITKIKIKIAASGEIFQDKMYITDHGCMYSTETVLTLQNRLQ